MTTRNAEPAPDVRGFSQAVKAYDEANPVRHAAVRSPEADARWVADQLTRRRTFLLKIARAFGLGDAALDGDPTDAQLDHMIARSKALLDSMNKGR
jgi:hypothetical protein